MSKKMGLAIIKKSFSGLAALIFLFIVYVYYKIKVVPLLPMRVQQDLKKYVGTVFIISLCFLIQRIAAALLGWYKENVALKTPTHLDDKLVDIFRRSANVIIWTIALLVTLPLYGVNISALVAALGVGSLAIALAAQDTIANIIAGFLILIDAPFRIGDKIRLPSGEIAEVLEIGVRRSKFLAEDKAIIIVPNLDLSKQKIINYTYGEKRV